jgi:hypothetical protein
MYDYRSPENSDSQGTPQQGGGAYQYPGNFGAKPPEYKAPDTPPKPAALPAPKPISGKAVTSIIMAGTGIVFWPLIVVLSPIGIVTGWLGMRETKGPGAPRTGRGLAIGGIVSNAVMLVCMATAIGLLVLLFTSIDSSSKYGYEDEAEYQFKSHRDVGEDMRELADRALLYYRENDESFGSGGPDLSYWRGYQASTESCPRIDSSLSIRDLVARYGLYNERHEYALELIDPHTIVLRHESGYYETTVNGATQSWTTVRSPGGAEQLPTIE